MSTRKPNVKIEDNKIIFSQEIINYFESLRNEGTSEWIDKYFEVLSDPSNFNAEKFNVHHIRPCCTFKDENHKNRKECEKLADEFKENSIKLSIHNHLKAHYYLWRIFDIQDVKTAFQRMCGQGKYVNNLMEEELKEIAELKETCAKENQTEEEKLQKDKEYKKIYNKIYYKHNKDKLLEDNKNYREQNHDRYIQYQRNYSKQYGKINREKYHDNIVKLNNAYVNQLCFDPILKNYCTYNQLRYRKNYGKNKKYENVKLSNCIIK